MVALGFSVVSPPIGLFVGIALFASLIVGSPEVDASQNTDGTSSARSGEDLELEVFDKYTSGDNLVIFDFDGEDDRIL
jgi:hypothetical protein